jgi:hypothetical protein
MARGLKKSGQSEIDNAKALFEQSVERGRPDYRLVALAIGAAPLRPPSWAIEACILAKETTERIPAAGTVPDEVGEVLDQIIRYYAGWQQDRPRDPPGSEHVPPSLREAIIASCRTLGLRTKQLDGAGNDDWMRDVRRAWDWEQVNDGRDSYLVLDGFNTTGRIDRVLTALYGAEMGMPSDPIKALWQHDQKKEPKKPISWIE